MNGRWPRNERRLIGFFLLMVAAGLILDASLVVGGMVIGTCGIAILVSAGSSGGDV